GSGVASVGAPAGDCLAAVGDAEFGVDVVDVFFHSFRGQRQVRRDLRVGEAVGDQVGDVAFAGRQAEAGGEPGGGQDRAREVGRAVLAVHQAPDRSRPQYRVLGRATGEHDDTAVRADRRYRREDRQPVVDEGHVGTQYGREP